MSNEDTIAIVWHIQDVIDTARDRLEYDLEEDDAREILSNIKRQHDATIGVNWDVIECHIEFYLAERGIL